MLVFRVLDLWHAPIRSLVPPLKTTTECKIDRGLSYYEFNYVDQIFTNLENCVRIMRGMAPDSYNSQWMYEYVSCCATGDEGRMSRSRGVVIEHVSGFHFPFLWPINCRRMDEYRMSISERICYLWPALLSQPSRLSPPQWLASSRFPLLSGLDGWWGLVR